MDKRADQSSETENWYCFQTLTKKEHVAAGHIRIRVDSPVFCPRIRYLKLTKKGKRFFTEALFPGYIFVYISLPKDLRHILSMPGIRKVVSFGEHIPVVCSMLIDELRKKFDRESFYEIPEAAVNHGDKVVITEGTLLNLEALVSGFIPAKDRIRLLLEILGREVSVVLPLSSVMVKEKGPMTDFRKENCQ